MSKNNCCWAFQYYCPPVVRPGIDLSEPLKVPFVTGLYEIDTIKQRLPPQYACHSVGPHYASGLHINPKGPIGSYVSDVYNVDKQFSRLAIPLRAQTYSRSRKINCANDNWRIWSIC